MVPDWFKERISRFRERVSTIPDDLWVKCPACTNQIYKGEWERALKVCPRCGYHFRLTAAERLDMTVDPDSFVPFGLDLPDADPLDFPEYLDKLQAHRSRTGLNDAIIAGTAAVEGYPVVLSITDSHFMMGSVGAVFGEVFVRTVERATDLRLPFIIISGSGGGMRMQEGLISLMQMAKMASAVDRLHQARLPYVAVLTDPTMAGALASFASLGDIIISEPRVQMGFAGSRVIANLRTSISTRAHTSEFHQQHGQIDILVPRSQVRHALARLLAIIHPNRDLKAEAAADA